MNLKLKDMTKDEINLLTEKLNALHKIESEIQNLINKDLSYLEDELITYTTYDNDETLTYIVHFNIKCGLFLLYTFLKHVAEIKGFGGVSVANNDMAFEFTLSVGNSNII